MFEIRFVSHNCYSSCEFMDAVLSSSPGFMQGELYVGLTSSHGMACPLPMVDKIQWQFLFLQSPAPATRDAAEGCKLQKVDALRREEGSIAECDPQLPCSNKEEETHSAVENGVKQETETAANDAATSVSAAVNRSDFEPCSGEICVDGNKGPIVFCTNLNTWPSTDGVHGQVALCLQLTFGCGADACLRYQNVVLDIAVDKVPCMMLASSIEKMWSAAESCQAGLELKTQVQGCSLRHRFGLLL